MKIIRYVVKYDAGLAPNPFHGWCSLAVCTPNHQRAKVNAGDWIVGNSERPNGGSDDDRRLIYAMCVEKVMTMDEYFNADEFQAKKPKPFGSPEEQCGDNFYFTDSTTKTWRRLPSMFHNDPAFFFKDLGKDLSGRKVFVGREYYYFGENAKKFPSEYRRLIAIGRGIRAEGADHLFSSFIDWLRKNHTRGCLGRPRDMKNIPVIGPMVTGYKFCFDENWSDKGRDAVRGGASGVPAWKIQYCHMANQASEAASVVATKSCAPGKRHGSQGKK